MCFPFLLFRMEGLCKKCKKKCVDVLTMAKCDSCNVVFHRSCAKLVKGVSPIERDWSIVLCGRHGDQGLSLNIPDDTSSTSAQVSPSFSPFDSMALEDIITRVLKMHLDTFRKEMVSLMGSYSGRVVTDEITALKEENSCLKTENESLRGEIDRLIFSSARRGGGVETEVETVGGLSADAPVFVAVGPGEPASGDDSVISYASVLNAAPSGQLSTRPPARADVRGDASYRSSGAGSTIGPRVAAPASNSGQPSVAFSLDRSGQSNRRRPRIRGSGGDFSISGTARRRWFHVNNLAPNTTVQQVVEHVRDVVGISDVTCESLTSNTKYCSFKVCIPEADIPKFLNDKVWPKEASVRDFYYRKPAGGDRSAQGNNENFLAGRSSGETTTG